MSEDREWGKALVLVGSWAAFILLAASFLTPKLAFGILLLGSLWLAYKLISDSWLG